MGQVDRGPIDTLDFDGAVQLLCTAFLSESLYDVSDCTEDPSDVMNLAWKRLLAYCRLDTEVVPYISNTEDDDESTVDFAGWSKMFEESDAGHEVEFEDVYCDVGRFGGVLVAFKDRKTGNWFSPYYNQSPSAQETAEAEWIPIRFVNYLFGASEFDGGWSVDSEIRDH